MTAAAQTVNGSSMSRNLARPEKLLEEACLVSLIVLSLGQLIERHWSIDVCLNAGCFFGHVDRRDDGEANG